ncbi:hypothetical protein [Planomonospora algeriensis]
MLTTPRLEDLAEDLHLAIATGEITRDRAITALALAAPGLGFDGAEQVLERKDPIGEGNRYDRLPDGRFCPAWGNSRRIWDHTEGDKKGVRVLPDLIAKWGRPLASIAPVTA